MSLLDADGFDHYGAPLTSGNAGTALAANGYTNVSCTIENNINGVTPPTGLGFLYFSTAGNQIARPVPAANVNQSQQVKLNFSAGVYGSDIWGIVFCDTNLGVIAKAVFRNNGAVAITTTAGTGNILAQTEASLVKFSSWQTWEFVYKPNTGAGTVGSPYNGIVQLWLEGILKAQATGLSISTICAFHLLGPNGVVGNGLGVCAKDWISNDANAPYFNSIPLGPRRTSTRIVNGNGAVNSWTANGAASQWQSVAKNAPNLTSYIEGVNPGDIQEFTLPASLNTIAGVTGLVVKAYASKTNSGVGTLRLGIISAGSSVNSAELTLGTGAAYVSSGGIGFDPATGAPFTSAAYNAIGLRITRVQ